MRETFDLRGKKKTIRGAGAAGAAAGGGDGVVSSRREILGRNAEQGRRASMV